ncbi:hypothetical protein P154DRAFT_276223 [Amniculicola lignicola CBS 123094]|uniref:Uncharacterized protein n=1 Tax=Amniculicola lignicola CBS 123094 TaxID=1392246 RepID=A0A6A5W6T6_9PLEO|nr:hypothetical protein P154DRAFT_276223 [Amniculicola lignicola CBS 123094]
MQKIQISISTTLYTSPCPTLPPETNLSHQNTQSTGPIHMWIKTHNHIPTSVYEPHRTTRRPRIKTQASLDIALQHIYPSTYLVQSPLPLLLTHPVQKDLSKKNKHVIMLHHTPLHASHKQALHFPKKQKAKKPAVHKKKEQQR